ncbi:MAG: alpha/beta hydrolase-fold protein, partial [Rhizomicrobium sp.]
MRRDHSLPAGQVHRLTFDSRVLQDNLLGDPATRIIDVYTPTGVKSDGLPLLVDLVGFTAGGPAHTNWKNFTENAPERLDRLIASGAMPPVVVAFPDCFTKLGGNQYINSAGTGRWADFLLEEAVPFVERRFHCGGTGRRGVFGKSSGGYGAITHALL